MIGTSDQSCWLAEACKILLLRLHTKTTLPSTHVQCLSDESMPLIVLEDYVANFSHPVISINPPTNPPNIDHESIAFKVAHHLHIV